MISKPDLTYEKINWSSYYKYRAFVAYEDSILAVGGCGSRCGGSSTFHQLQTYTTALLKRELSFQT